MTPAKFTEWLMQQGLILQEQWEFLPNGSKLKLKLAMHSDGKRFATSGGYVWVNERNTGK